MISHQIFIGNPMCKTHSFDLLWRFLHPLMIITTSEIKWTSSTTPSDLPGELWKRIRAAHLPICLITVIVAYNLNLTVMHRTSNFNSQLLSPPRFLFIVQWFNNNTKTEQQIKESIQLEKYQVHLFAYCMSLYVLESSLK